MQLVISWATADDAHADPAFTQLPVDFALLVQVQATAGEVVLVKLHDTKLSSLRLLLLNDTDYRRAARAQLLAVAQV